MLVLTRKKDESIMLGDEIEIVVVEITSTQVRLGIKAPKQLEVFRKELYEAIREENRQSASLSLNVEKRKEELKDIFKNK